MTDRDAPPPEDAQALGPPGDPESAARTICLRLLDRRARTRAELATALAQRGIPADVAQQVLGRFAEVGLVDDNALAEGFALAQHRERGLAGRAVAAKLRQRGVAEDAVHDALAHIDRDSEREVARRLVDRKLRSMAGLDVQVAARRLVGLLARKGYPSGLAYEVVRTALAERDDADGTVDALAGTAED